MESSTATHPQPAPPVDAVDTAPPVDAVEAVSLNGFSSRARQRGAVLGGMLFFGDSLAARRGHRVRPPRGRPLRRLRLRGRATLLWPLAAFSIGLYRSDQLATWASCGDRGAPRIRRGAADHLAPLRDRLRPAPRPGGHPDLPHRGRDGRFSPAIARTVVRAGLHRAPDLRQRTLILGSGVVAGQVVEKLRNNAQFGLVPVGIVDDEVHNVGTPDLPWLGRFEDLAR